MAHGATFVALAQSMQYLSAILAPLIGTRLADSIGLSDALWMSAALRLFGFILFMIPDGASVKDALKSGPAAR